MFQVAPKNGLLSLLFMWLLSVLFVPAGALALDPTKTLDQYLYRSWGTEEGLPQASAYSIVQTDDGHIWFGTQGGLIRFDGVQFELFDNSNTKELTYLWVATIEVAQNGDMWLGGHSGLTRVRDGVFEDFTTKEIEKTDGVVDILEDKNGTLWIATLGGGLLRYDGQRFKSITTRDGLADDWINAIWQARNGELLIASEGGLDVLVDGEVIRTFKSDVGLPDKKVHALHEDRQGRLWIGTSGGVCLFEGKRCKNYKKEQGLTDLLVRAIFQDSDGGIWVATYNGGAFVLRDGRFTNEGIVDGIKKETISFFEDREGNFYIGTGGRGLFQLRDGKLTNFQPIPGVMVWTFLEDDDGTFWISTNGGVVHYRDDGKYIYNRDSGLTNDAVLAMASAKGKGIWVGTNGDGLAYLEDGKVTFHFELEGMNDKRIRALYEDRDGFLWIGTKTSGLFKFKDGKVVKRFTIEEGMPANGVSGIIAARAGGIWVATYGGLARIQNDQISAPMEEAGLPRTRCYGPYEDSSGNLWFSSSGAGAWLYRKGRFTSYRRKDGAPGDAVYNVMDDLEGNLWLSSDQGIARLSKQAFFDFADGKINKVPSELFGTADGMKNRECNGGAQYNALRTADGRIWVATVAGAVIVDNDKLKINEVAPSVVVQKALINDRKAVEGQMYDAGAYDIEFRFASLSFVAPEKNLYRYRLEGYDKQWSPRGTEMSVRYTNLKSGNYKFRVQGSNNDGVWSENGDSFSFSIERFYYQTWWFWTLIVLFVGLMLYWVVRWRDSISSKRTERRSVLYWEKTKEMFDEQVDVIRHLAADASAVARDLQDTLMSNTSPSAQVLGSFQEKAARLNFLIDRLLQTIASWRSPDD